MSYTIVHHMVTHFGTGSPIDAINVFVDLNPQLKKNIRSDWENTFRRFILLRYLVLHAGCTTTEAVAILGSNSHANALYAVKQYRALKDTRNREFLKVLTAMRDLLKIPDL